MYFKALAADCCRRYLSCIQQQSKCIECGSKKSSTWRVRKDSYSQQSFLGRMTLVRFYVRVQSQQWNELSIDRQSAVNRPSVSSPLTQSFTKAAWPRSREVKVCIHPSVGTQTLTLSSVLCPGASNAAAHIFARFGLRAASADPSIPPLRPSSLCESSCRTYRQRNFNL